MHWTKTFSYDFRTPTLMNQLECVTNQILKIDPMFGPNVKLLLSDLMAKVMHKPLINSLLHCFCSLLFLVEYSRSI